MGAGTGATRTVARVGREGGGSDRASDEDGGRELDEDNAPRWWGTAMLLAMNTDERVVEGGRER